MQSCTGRAPVLQQWSTNYIFGDTRFYRINCKNDTRLVTRLIKFELIDEDVNQENNNIYRTKEDRWYSANISFPLTCTSIKKKTSDRRTERREQNQDESIIGTGGVLVIFQEKIVEHTVGNSHPVRSANTTSSSS